MKSHTEAENWLRRRLSSAPFPLPRGRFPHMLIEGEKNGFTRDQLLDVLDEWLNFGYCEIDEPITQDINVLPAGEMYFFKK